MKARVIVWVVVAAAVIVFLVAYVNRASFRSPGDMAPVERTERGTSEDERPAREPPPVERADRVPPPAERAERVPPPVERSERDETTAEPPTRDMRPVSRPPGGAQRLSAVRRILDDSKLANIAFNTPGALNVHETAVIQLLLDMKTPIDELKEKIKAAGEREGARVEVSDRMEARLTGSNFAITAITAETQAVSRGGTTEWKWEVKPTEAGSHHLHLTLSAFLDVDGESTPHTVRTFEKVIHVDVTWSQRVGSFFEVHWKWLWAAVLVPLVSWLWRKRKQAAAGDARSDG